MSRYIEADALKEKIDNIWEGRPLSSLGARILTMIDEAPSIDIVRCSECVYCNVQNTKYLYAICERHGIESKPFEDDTRTHGCSWGERKDDDMY